ncbi:MAG TPA: hopanoid C-3 methylase HpnR [Candidatus Eisenbacteria bacterium]|nr:hopanoid C-3 methylase HpnR [Candidatus Eisenbacteria bacterium]
MRVLLVHPSPLLFSEIYLRLEPLGLERVASAILAAGHDVELLDLQVFPATRFHAAVASRPDAIGFSLNYLANVPEVIDLARAAKAALPSVRIFVGGHSASFIAEDILRDAGGAIDCVVRGEGEGVAPKVLDAFRGGPALDSLPGVVALDGAGPAPLLIPDLSAFPPARHLLGRRSKYFIGELDPCASVELTRGCPWDCAFCSAWTFYGRSYRRLSAEAAGEDLARVEEPNVFLVDDVAFIRAEDGMAIADEVERRGIRKRYYLETRADVLLRNREVFARWTKLGLRYMFLGIEAIDAEGLKRHRKRVDLGENERALEYARELGLVVAINIIADPDWDEQRFQVIREWALEVPEIVNMTINTPYPGTETWLTESRRLSSLDYRLFDVQHAVLPTRLPLRRFYEEFVKTQEVLSRKHLGWRAVYDIFGIVMRLLARGQTNFIRMLWSFNSVYSADRLCADHARELRYRMTPPPAALGRAPVKDELYIHQPTAIQSDAATASAAP